MKMLFARRLKISALYNDAQLNIQEAREEENSLLIVAF